MHHSIASSSTRGVFFHSRRLYMKIVVSTFESPCHSSLRFLCSTKLNCNARSFLASKTSSEKSISYQTGHYNPVNGYPPPPPTPSHTHTSFHRCAPSDARARTAVTIVLCIYNLRCPHDDFTLCSVHCWDCVFAYIFPKTVDSQTR